MAKPRAQQQQTARSADPNDVEVGRRMRERRLELKLSQTDLGEAVGVTFQQIQKYEKGANRVTMGRLTDIARVLDVPLTFFFDKESKASHAATNKSLEFLSAADAVRLIKAHNRMGPELRATFVALAESIATRSTAYKKTA